MFLELNLDNLSAWFNHFQINNKFLNENRNFGSFSLIFDFPAERKRSRAESSRAENPSARAMDRASSVRTHH